MARPSSDALVLDRAIEQALARAKSVSDLPAAFPVSAIYRRARALTVTANQTDGNGAAPTLTPISLSLHAVGSLHGDGKILGRRAFVARAEGSQGDIVRKLHSTTGRRSRANKLHSAVLPTRTRSRSASPSSDAPGACALKPGGLSCPASMAPYADSMAGSRWVEGPEALHPFGGIGGRDGGAR